MGIPGLLPALNSITVDTHISDLADKRVAIDAYCWLHRGVYTCSTELCQGIPTDKYISYCLKKLALLRQFNITPVVVLDGGPLPVKQNTENSRRKSREEYLSKGWAYLKEDNPLGARECFQKAVDVTPKMAHELIKRLRLLDVEYYVAPYEADAQLAFFALTGYVDAVITEDSDLIVYGCPRVLFKMDEYGHGKEIKFENLGSSVNPSFRHFSLDMFRQVCILAGCDYCTCISGLGIKRAHALMKKYRNIHKIIHFLKSSKNFAIPEGYEEMFRRAELTFHCQRVFDPTKNEVVPLHPIDQHHFENLDFLGPEIPPSVAVEIAVGNLDPVTKLPFVQDTNSGNSTDFNSNNLISKEQKLTKRMDVLPVQKNTIASYFKLAPVSSATKKPFVPPRSSKHDQPSDQVKDLGTSMPGNQKSVVVISRFFSSEMDKKLCLVRTLLGADESSSMSGSIPSFSSPLVMDKRLSLQGADFKKYFYSKGSAVDTSQHKKRKLEATVTPTKEECVEISDEEFIQSDSEEWMGL